MFDEHQITSQHFCLFYIYENQNSELQEIVSKSRGQHSRSKLLAFPSSATFGQDYTITPLSTWNAALKSFSHHLVATGEWKMKWHGPTLFRHFERN